ncbi:DUF4376 domain-containing protein [Escherichia coli]|uniref:DUF4376 domain-containing protein n=1 Tax=Escherichia coli TaxID=562 RepID=UPI003F8760AC
MSLQADAGTTERKVRPEWHLQYWRQRRGSYLIFWTDAENNDVPMTAEVLIALSEAAQQAMFIKGLEIHRRQREMEKAVEALPDADAVLAYRVDWK